MCLKRNYLKLSNNLRQEEKKIMEFLKDLMNKASEVEGLNVSALEPGTKLVIETKNSFYDIKIVEAKKVTIFGGSIGNNTRFSKPVNAIIHGSTWGSSAIMVDWIGRNMYLEFNVEGGKTYVTSSIQNITIESPDGSWNYSMGWC